MAKLPAARSGEALRIKGNEVPFSYWPVFRRTRRFGLQAHIYADNPWTTIHQSITSACPAGARAEARACAEQGEFFFRSAAAATEWAAKPLALYYGIMNVAKAFALTRGVRPSFDRAKHGVSERLGAGGREIHDAFLELHPSSQSKLNVFDDFVKALTGHALPTPLSRVTLPALLPQILPGHRLWCQATGKTERFIPVSAVSLRQDAHAKLLWLNIEIAGETFARLSLSAKQVSREARLQPSFRHVRNDASTSVAHCFEMTTAVSYPSRPSDRVSAVIDGVRDLLWRTATTVEPYRKYYIYCAPTAEHPQVLPQLCGIYLTTFYLGSITRYRPQQFADVLAKEFGGFIQEFLITQPRQFLYLAASEIARRDVVRAALA